jgi:hypothetical protein
MTSAERSRPANRRLLHDDKAGELEVLHKPPCHDLCHDLIGVVDALAALEAQREGERVSDVFGRGGRSDGA